MTNDDILGEKMREAFMDRIGEIAGPWMDAEHLIRAGWRAAARVSLDQIKIVAVDNIGAPDSTSVRETLDDLQQAEAEYRAMHDRHGDGGRATGRAWDLMRRAGDRARLLLNSAVTQ